MTETKILYQVTPELVTFIKECDKLGFKNNNSLDTMKFDWCLDMHGAWFATFDNNKIVGISGAHPFRDGYRALFRGAQLYSRPGGLSKNHMNCWMFYYHLPMVIDACINPIYVTTNIDNDASGKMLKLNKLYYILSKKGFFDLISTEEIYGVQQNIWKLNKEYYMDVRSRS